MNANLVRWLRASAFGLLLATASAVLGAAPAAALSGVVNVNTATAEELMGLPGIGEAKARAILELRNARGTFRSVEELVEVKGIGPAALERIRPHVALDGKTTLQED